MMEDQFDHIEKYLRGELSKEETTRFESRMEEHSDLKEKVDKQRQLLKGIELGFNQELKEILIKEESKLSRPRLTEANRIKTLYPVIGMAAAVSLVIIAFFTLRNKTVDTSELYAQYYQPYPNVEAPISRSDFNELNPYGLYEKGEYNEALSQFSALRTSKPDDPALLFYSAICQMELGTMNDAISSFKELLGLDANKYTRPSKWYLALAYLNSGQTSEAVSYLNELTQIDDVYARKAAELLHQLNQE